MEPISVVSGRQFLRGVVVPRFNMRPIIGTVGISFLISSSISSAAGVPLPDLFISMQEPHLIESMGAPDKEELPSVLKIKPAPQAAGLRESMASQESEVAHLTGTGAMLLSFETYAKNAEVMKMIRVMKAKAGRPKGQCYRHAKVGLRAAGLVDRYLKGESAKGAGRELEKSCFRNIMGLVRTPEAAPVGAILVYEGGRHGHLEVRTEDGFVSDYTSRIPRTGGGAEGRNRVLKAVYVKFDTSDRNCRSVPMNLASN